jgi:L-amino acid N-acyltransferase YncA
MLIRPATKRDIDAIVNVHLKSWIETYTGVIRQSILDGQSFQKRKFMWDEIFADPTQKTYVSELDGNICGFMNLKLTAESHISELKKLYILNVAQGQGLGRMFIQTALETSKHHHYQYMQCRVLSANTSRFFYEKTGAYFVHQSPALDLGEGLSDLDYQWRIE